MKEDKQAQIIVALDLIEKGIINRSRYEIQRGFDIIDNFLSIEWNEIPKEASKYNMLLSAIDKIEF